MPACQSRNAQIRSIARIRRCVWLTKRGSDIDQYIGIEVTTVRGLVNLTMTRKLGKNDFYSISIQAKWGLLFLPSDNNLRILSILTVTTFLSMMIIDGCHSA